MEVNQEIQEAIGEYKQGNKDVARKIMRNFIKTNPDDEIGWMVYAKITDNDGERIRSLRRVIEINPSNQEAIGMLKKMGIYEQREKPTSNFRVNEETKNESIESTKKCPFCAEKILEDAIICRYCQSSLEDTPRMRTIPSENIISVAKNGPSSGAKTLGGISIVCGLIGLIIAGIPLGIIAIACGIPALNGGEKNGKTGIILGIIDIVLAIIILASN